VKGHLTTEEITTLLERQLQGMIPGLLIDKSQLDADGFTFEGDIDYEDDK
jgi:hypothetical protein